MEKNTQMPSKSSSSSMMSKKKGKSRAGIYVALVFAFLGLFGVGVVAGVMFFTFNSSLSSLQSSVEMQNDKLDELSDDVMSTKDDVDMLETDMKDSTSSSSSSTSSSSSVRSDSISSAVKTFFDSRYGFSFSYPSEYRLFSPGEKYTARGGEETYLGPDKEGHYIFASRVLLGELDSLYENNIVTEGPSGVQMYVSDVDESLTIVHAQRATSGYTKEGETIDVTIGSYDVLRDTVSGLGEFYVYSLEVDDRIVTIVEPTDQGFAEDVIASIEIE